MASLAPALTLAFEVQPTQVTLRRWPAEYVGRTQEGEDQAETLEAENGTVLLPGTGTACMRSAPSGVMWAQPAMCSAPDPRPGRSP